MSNSVVSLIRTCASIAAATAPPGIEVQTASDFIQFHSFQISNALMVLGNARMTYNIPRGIGTKTGGLGTQALSAPKARVRVDSQVGGAKDHAAPHRPLTTSQLLSLNIGETHSTGKNAPALSAGVSGSARTRVITRSSTHQSGIGLPRSVDGAPASHVSRRALIPASARVRRSDSCPPRSRAGQTADSNKVLANRRQITTRSQGAGLSSPPTPTARRANGELPDNGGSETPPTPPYARSVPHVSTVVPLTITPGGSPPPVPPRDKGRAGLAADHPSPVAAPPEPHETPLSDDASVARLPRRSPRSSHTHCAFAHKNVPISGLAESRAADLGLDHMTHGSATHGSLSAVSGPHDTDVVAARLGDDREVGDPTDAAPPPGHRC